MNSTHFFRVYASALIFGVATVAWADSPAPGPQPVETTEKKEEPVEAKPRAEVGEAAEAVLKEMGRAYGALKTLELAGTIKLEVEEKGKPSTREASFASSYQSPNLFRHQAQNQPVLGSTGKKVYGYSQATNAYSLADAPAEKARINELPEDHAKILPAQSLSLTLALSKDPAAELREVATKIEKVADQQIEGKAHPTLKLTLAEDGQAMTVALDPATHLVRRTTLDLTPTLKRLGRPDIAAASFTVDYATTKAGGEPKPEQFAWAPPAGARDLAAIRAAVAGEEEGAAEANALIGKPAPDFTLKDLDGKDVTLSDLQGSVVLLDFWATWCGPCVASMPHLDELHKELGKDGLKLYAVNLREPKDKVEAFLKKKSLSLPVVFDTEGDVAKQFLVQGIPQTVLIGKDGAVKKVFVGFDPDAEDAMRDAIVQEMRAKFTPKPKDAEK